jgi:hypothetical protein
MPSIRLSAASHEISFTQNQAKTAEKTKGQNFYASEKLGGKSQGDANIAHSWRLLISYLC